MKKITNCLWGLLISFILISNTIIGQTCSSPTPLTVGANDATCNSSSFSSLNATDFDAETPAITTVTNTCGVGKDHNPRWYTFTGDGTTYRFKIFGQDQASQVLVFTNLTCAASITASQCATFPDDNLPHTLDINTVNGTVYKVAVVKQSGSNTMVGNVCVYKTNGLPYSSICDHTPVALTVKTKNVDCFAAGNYVNVNTNKTTLGDAPPTPCQPSATFDEWWIGKFTAIDTKTELYFWGKDETGASIEVLQGPCSGAMTSVYCNSNTGLKESPTSGSMTTVVGQDYFVIVKTSGSSDYGRLCIYSQPVEPTKPFCTAPMSFEDGTGAGWVKGSGAYHLVSAPGNTWTYTYPTVGTAPSAKFAVTSGTGVDPIVGGMLPVVAPGGGTYSFRLGDNVGGGYALTVPGQVGTNQASSETMSFDFVVSAANAGFGYKYATVMDNAGHAPEIQNMFSAVLTLPNSGGTIIPCGNYTHIPNDGVSPFYFIGDNTDVTSSLNYCFTPWTDVITDLSGYVGQTVRATFTVRDCAGGCGTCTSNPYTDPQAGGHWAYSYIDTYCIPIAIVTPEYCAGTSSIQICGPPGYQTYSWPAGQPGVTGPLNGQCVTINTPSSHTGTTYTVNATSISGCPITATVILKSIPLTVSTPASICPSVATNVSVSVDNPINPPYNFTWSHGLGTGAGPKSVSPAATTTYTVTVTNGVGCSATQAVVVNVAACGITATTTPATICNGACGTITASGSGGTPNYTYTWNTGATTSSLSVCPTSTTTYTVTVRDNNGTGNSATATSVVTVNPKPTVTVPPATICNGNSTTLTASGANTYTWSPGTGLSATTGTSVTANPTTTSTYTIVGTTTATGCTNSTTVVVTVNPKPTVTAPPATICNGNSTTLTASGANTYTWSPSTGLSATTGTSVTANPTATSTYTIVGTTTATGCTNSTTVIVTVNPKPTVTVPAATICNGNSTTLTASGADTYTWTPTTGLSSDTGTTVTANPTTSSTYTVVGTITATGCTNSTTVVVTVNPNPTVTVPPATICAGASTTLTASGATTYTWALTTGLSAGTGTTVNANPTTTTTYTIVGTTAGCTGSTAVVVTVNPIPVVSVPSASICPGGSTPLTASGATTYTWSPGTGLSATTGTTVTANPSASSTYTVIGTSSGCTGSTTVVVSVGALVANAGSNVAICNGTSTNLGASGGTVFSWTPTTGLSDPNISNPVANPTVTTTYTVVVTDGACSDDATVIVTVNPNPIVTVPAATICEGTSTNLTASGANTYTWTPTTGLSSGTGTTVTANPTITTTYTVTGSFTTGCTGTTTVVVTVNPIPIITIPGATICEGNATTLTASGANTYTWTPAATLNSSTGTSVTANPTVTTTYTVVGTSTAGCTSSTTVIVNVIPPCGPSINATGVTVCEGICGTVTSTATGGVPGYTYLWNTGATTDNITECPAVTTTYTVTVTDNSVPIGTATAIAVITVNPNPIVTVPDATICDGTSTTLIASGADTYTWTPTTGLSSGTGTTVTANPASTTTYTVTGSFTTGCTGTTTVVVTVNPIPIVSVPNASICPGGSTILNATGATTYSWSPATGLSATSGSSVTANPASTTTYTVCGTTNGCSACTTVTVSVGALVADAGPDKFICDGGSTSLSASGGTIFTWTPSIGLSDPTISNPVANPTVTTTYTVNVSDGFCSDDDIVVVVVNPPIALNVAGIDVTCFGACNGQLIVIPSGGTAPYSFIWSTGCTAAACNNICAGTYSLVTTDVMGCTASATTTVNEPTALTVAPTGQTNVSCFGVCDGTASVSANGGTMPYTYAWSPNGGAAANATNFCAGTYTCTVTDANNCTVNSIVIITQPTAVVVNSTGTSICPNTCATLNVNGSGGSAPISFSWNSGALTGASVSVCPTITTTYTIVGTDVNGCTGETSVIVTVEPTPIISVPAVAICEGTSTTLTANGANTYSWTPITGLSSGSGSSVTANPTTTTTYTVVGTSTFGCTGSVEVVVTVNPRPVLIPISGNACPGDSISLSVSGANTYLWSPSLGLTSTTASNVIATIPVTTVYTVIGTGTNGCTSTTTVTATVNPKPNAIFTTSPEPVDLFDPTVYFTDYSTGGTINIWNWSFGDPNNSTSTLKNPIFTYPDTANKYQVRLIVTNQYGCIDTVISTVTIKGIYSFYIPNTFTPNGDFSNDIFMPKGTGIDEEDYDLWIFDRWGNMIWHTRTWGEGWDGRANGGAEIAQIDTYVWKVRVREKDSGIKHNYIGHVNIVK